MARSNILAIGPKTPPTHGFAVITEAAVRLLTEKFSVKYIAISSNKPNSILRHLEQFFLLWASLIHIMRHYMAKGSTVYLGFNAGYGQLYNLLQICSCRILRLKLVIHHHSYAYINDFSLLSWLCLKAAGLENTHITLTEKMALDLKARYPINFSTIAISNATFVNCSQALTQSTSKPVKVGLISNLDASKGLYDFLSIAAAGKELFSDLEFLLAGPIRLEEDRVSVDRHVEQGIVDYRGPLYGSDKDNFFDEVDLLIFPTRYKHEAQPTIIYEAYSRRVPVVSVDRGTIVTTVVPKEFVAESMSKLESLSIEIIRSMVHDRAYVKELSELVFNEFEAGRKTGQHNFLEIFKADHTHGEPVQN